MRFGEGVFVSYNSIEYVNTQGLTDTHAVKAPGKLEQILVSTSEKDRDLNSRHAILI